jgi:tetratricopeptide (TPR) repeat protein
MKISNKAAVIILILVGLINFFKVTSFDFVIDDKIYITQNSVTLQGVSAYEDILTKPSTHGFYNFHQKGRLYRPLTLFSYAIDKSLTDNNVAFMHFENLALYILCSILLFFLLQRVFKENTGVNLLLALYFLILPVHQEVVAVIKSRDDLFATLFFLFSLLSLLKYQELKVKKHLVFSILFFGLSLFSKENAVSFIAIYPLVLVLLKGESWSKSLKTTLYYLIPLFLYLSIRWIIIKDIPIDPLTVENNGLLEIESIGMRKLTAFYLLGVYFIKMFIPYPLLWDYSQGFWSFNSLTSAIGFGVLLLILFSIYWSYTKKHYALLFGILFFLITISLTSNIFIEILSTFADRFIFTPSIGFLFILHHFRKLRYFNHALITLMVIFTFINFAQLPAWKNDTALFEENKQFMTSQKSQVGYVDNLILNNRLDEGLETVNLYLETTKNNAYLYHLKGMILLRKERVDEAIVSYKKALEINPNFTNALSDIARCYSLKKENKLALEQLLKAIQIEPNNFLVIKNLAAIYYNLGNLEKSQVYFEKAYSMNPTDETVQALKPFLEGSDLKY